MSVFLRDQIMRAYKPHSNKIGGARYPYANHVAIYNDAAWLKQKYVEEKYSVRDIAQMAGVSKNYITKMLRSFNVQLRDKRTRHTDRCRIKARTAMIGEMNPQYGKRALLSTNFCGGRIARNGYLYLLMPDHPDANKKGYVAEHRLVAEANLGRRLQPSEVAHHINGIRSDNRPSNISVYSKSGHSKLHYKSKPVTRRRHEYISA